MADRGYERASVTAIAKAAGLTPGLVHYHFHNKKEILLALVTFVLFTSFPISNLYGALQGAVFYLVLAMGLGALAARNRR